MSNIPNLFEDLKFEIDYGTGFKEVAPPMNWKAMQVQVVFTNGRPSASLESINFEWVGDNAVKINEYRVKGLTGGPGIFEGLPLRISVCSGLPTLIFNGIIDLANEATRWECDMVKAPIRESGKLDYVMDRSAGFSFAYLASLTGSAPGRIVPATHYKRVPYAISVIPNYSQAMIMSISLFLTIKELLDVVNKLASWISDLTGQTATATAQLGTSAPTLLATLANVVLYLVYLFAIIVAIVDMCKSLVDNIVQPKKYKLAMREEDLFIKGFEFMGLGFSSTIYKPGSAFRDATWMPKKTTMLNVNNNPLSAFKRPANEGSGFPNNANVYGHYDGTFKDFIIDMMEKYNAEIRIVGNTAYFEEKHSWSYASSFILPNIGAPGYTYNYPAPYGTNASRLASNYFLGFEVDQSELNTLHRYVGTTCQVTLTPIVVKNKQNSLLKELEYVKLRCALAKRKEHLTSIESLLNGVLNALFGFVNFVIKAVNGVITVINKVINLFGGSGATLGTIPLLPTNILNNRIGWMEISNDSFAIPKTFIGTQVGSDWEIHPNSEGVMSAVNLMGAFHGKNLATRGNQQTLYDGKEFPMCSKEFNMIKGNNLIKTHDGKQGKLESLLWDIHSGRALNVKYSLYEKFTNNLQESIKVDGG